MASTREAVGVFLRRKIMKAIHNQCARFGEQEGFINYVDGANVGGFREVAEAMLDQGIV